MLTALNQQSLQQQQQQQQPSPSSQQQPSAAPLSPSHPDNESRTPSRKNSTQMGHHHAMAIKNDLSLSSDMHSSSIPTPCTPIKPDPGMHITHGFEPGGVVKGRQQQQQQQQRPSTEQDNLDEDEDFTMEEDTPVHPLAATPSEAMDNDQPTPASSLHPLPPLPGQHHPRQQPHHPNLLPSHPSISPQPDIVMTSSPGDEDDDEDDDACRNKPPFVESALDDDKHGRRTDRHLVIDTSSALHPGLKSSTSLTVTNASAPSSRAGSHQPEERVSTAEPPMTPQTATTPTTGATATMATNSASGEQNGASQPSAGPPSATTASSSSRRPSLRTMTATLPRSALQEETIALFKQYREFIPCAKCFCRNTIQRDGMSDGNLRFKCRPPVSMSLTCNKSYSESKIRNMIAGVVYGHTLPDPNGLSPSAAAAALAAAAAVNPSNSTAKGRRASHKVDDANGGPSNGSETDKITKVKSEQYPKLMGQDYQQSRQHPLDMGSSDEHRESLSRRPSMQQMRRSSMAAEDSMMMDYEEMGNSSVHRRPSGHLQDSRLLKVPGTPPMDGDDHRMYRSHSSQSIHHPQRPPTPTGPMGRSSSGPRLHHSQSHPNIGLHRQQQMDQGDRPHRSSLSGASGSGYHIPPYPSPGQPFQSRSLQRQLARRESSQYPSSANRFETERRMSHPVVLQSSSSGSLVDDQSQGKYLPIGGTSTIANSPALSASSPRSSPGRDHPPLPPHHHAQHSSHQQQQQQQQPLGSHMSANGGYSNGPDSSMSGTPIVRSLSVGRFDEPNGQDFPRRMSQPHASSPYQSYGGNSYDRRASEMDLYSSRSGNLSRSSSSSKLNKQLPLSSPMPKHPLDHADEHLHRSPILEAGGGLLRASSSTESIRYGYASSSVSGRRSYESLPDVVARGGSGSGGRPSIQYQYSGPESDRDDDDGELSPSYRDGDYDYPQDRIYAKARHGIKRKSLGQSLSRSSSNQNLYSASMRSNGSGSNSSKEVALANNTIRVTCFPNAGGSSPSMLVDGGSNNGGKSSTVVASMADQQAPSSITLDSTKAMAMNLQQSSKLVIEISPPLRSSASHPNLSSSSSAALISHRSNSLTGGISGKVASVLGRRRSASPDHFGGSSSKKRRADGTTDLRGGEASLGMSATTTSSNTLTLQSPMSSNTGASLSAVQLIGMDYMAKTDASASAMAAAAGAAAAAAAAANAASTPGSATTTTAPCGSKEGLGLGLGLPSSSSSSSSGIITPVTAVSYHATLESTMAKVSGLTMSSPAIEALSVAQAESGSSNATVTKSKHMDHHHHHHHHQAQEHDYSKFTRVETANWRILIPPHVVASFQSDNFGLVLRPKDAAPLPEEEGEEQHDVVDEQRGGGAESVVPATSHDDLESDIILEAIGGEKNVDHHHHHQFHPQLLLPTTDELSSLEHEMEVVKANDEQHELNITGVHPFDKASLSGEATTTTVAEMDQQTVDKVGSKAAEGNSSSTNMETDELASTQKADFVMEEEEDEVNDDGEAADDEEEEEEEDEDEDEDEDDEEDDEEKDELEGEDEEDDDDKDSETDHDKEASA